MASFPYLVSRIFKEVPLKLQHNLWGSILSFLNLDKYSKVWENSSFVAHCPNTLENQVTMD